MDKNKLAERLKILFSDYNDLEHSVLEKAEERAEFLIDCGKKLDEKKLPSVSMKPPSFSTAT